MSKEKVGSFLFTYCYFLYKILYFIYKNIKDREQIDYIRRIVTPDMIVIDVGANIGFYTVLFSKLAKFVYAFEPDKLNYMRLEKNIRKLKNVRVYPYAVGEKTGRIKLYQSELNTRHKTYGSGEGEYVKCVSLDDWHGDGFKVDFIKLDVEGYEKFVLMGMKRLLKTNPILLKEEGYIEWAKANGLEYTEAKECVK